MLIRRFFYDFSSILHVHAILSYAICFLVNVGQYLVLEFYSSLMIVLIIVFIELLSLGVCLYRLLPDQLLALVLGQIKPYFFELIIVFSISLSTRSKRISMPRHGNFRMYAT
jgi:hypothetical protein